MLRVDRKEALRYMRMGSAEPDAEMEARLARIERGVVNAARPAARWLLVPVEDAGCGPLRVGPLELRSEDLRRTLAGCRHAFLFVATLGAGVDAYLRRCGQLSAADLVMAQAVATALVETHCDECCERMARDPSVAGEKARMRFSPGYGDLALETQRPLLACLDAARRVGVSLTDSLLMVPSKSVSAIVGFSQSGGGERG